MTPLLTLLKSIASPRTFQIHTLLPLLYLTFLETVQLTPPGPGTLGERGQFGAEGDL